MPDWIGLFSSFIVSDVIRRFPFLLFTWGPALPKSAYSCLFLLNSAYSCLFRHKEAYFFIKICIYQKKCVPLHPQSAHWGPRRALTECTRWGERRQWSHLRFSGAVSFLRSICRTRRVPLHSKSKFPYSCSFFTPLGNPKHGNDTDSTRNRVRGKCTLNREQSLPNNHLLWHESN